MFYLVEVGRESGNRQKLFGSNDRRMERLICCWLFIVTRLCRDCRDSVGSAVGKLVLMESGRPDNSNTCSRDDTL